MKSNRNTWQRTLAAESLERRELLAADLWCRGAALPPDLQQAEIVMVQNQAGPASAGVSDAPPQEQVRSGENSDTGVGRQKRPRDRDSQDATVIATASASISATSDEPKLDAPQPQERERADENSDTGVGAQKRPRDRDSEDATSTTSTLLETAAVDTIFAASVRQRGTGGSGTQQNTVQLSEAEADSILLLREEEKLARDVYITLAEMWNEPIFQNIAQSESQHMEAVKSLIDKYGLTDPVTDDTVGEFTNPIFAEHYEALVEMGSKSLLDAYKVGAYIEELDILDIRHALVDVTHADVQNVYENLMRGSSNHLRSFVAQIEVTAGETYVPVLLTGTDLVTGENLDVLYQEIISGDQDTANGNGRGGRRR
jgi:hypothetical protein